MQAVVQTGYGDSSVLTFSTSQPAPPPPTAHQVQVRVHACSINSIDSKLLHGNLRAIMPTKFPHVPGQDVSGVVVAVGSAVTKVAVGDAVMAQNSAAGAYSELNNIADELISLKPASVTFAEAAVYPLAAQTALSGLEKASFASGEKIVVTGASGGVGTFVVQIAKLLGAAQVVGVSSGKNAEYVRSLGADEVVDYTVKKVSEALPKEYDVVFDCVGGKDQWEEAQKVLKVGGRFVTIVGDDRENKVTVGSVLSVGSAIVGRKLSGVFSSQHHSYFLHFLTPNSKLLDRVADWLKDGKLKVNVDRRFPFSEQGVRDMYDYLDKGRTVGKIVMEVIKEGEERAQQQQSTVAPSAASTESSTSASSSSADTTNTESSASSPPVAATNTDTAAAATTSTGSASSSESADHAAHSTQSAVSVTGGGTGGSVDGTVGDLPTAPHTDVSTGSID